MNIDLNINLNEPEEVKMTEESIIKMLFSKREKILKQSAKIDIKYVVHTSSIPFISMFDPWEIGVPELFIDHEHHDDIEEDLCCYKSNKRLFPEKISKSCPCREHAQEGKELKYLCYLEFLRGLNKKSDMITEKEFPFNYENTMICFNSVSILQDKYTNRIALRTGAKGWSQIKNFKELEKVLNCLYWFKKMKEKKKLIFLKALKKEIKNDFQKFKYNFQQIMHTINGIVLKTLLVMGSGIKSYDQFHNNFPKMFLAFYRDYTREPKKTILGEHEKENSIFKELKEFYGKWKESFHSESFSKRLAGIQYRFKSSVLDKYWSPLLEGIGERIQNLYMHRGLDYTRSIAWYSIGGILGYTRVLGYLPDYLSVDGLLSYIDRMEKEVIIPELEREQVRIDLLKYLGIKHHDKKMVREFLSPLFYDMRISKERKEQLKDEVMSRIRMDVKKSASYNEVLSQGGKLEDARVLLNLAEENNFKIYIRDLENGKVLTVLNYNDLKKEDHYQVALYWISIQLLINSLWKHKGDDYYKDKYIPYYIREYGGDVEYLPNLFKAEIIRISEPGKSRLLIKSQSYLVWALSLYNKILQNALGTLDEHKVGLKGSSNAWKHYLRYSPEIPESEFMYDDNSQTKDEIFQCFQDWTEATDNICLIKASEMLILYGNHLGLPLFFNLLCSMGATQETEYTCRLACGREYFDLKGTFKRGMMMGNPVTKTVLHLEHGTQLSGGNTMTAILKPYIKRFLEKKEVLKSSLKDYINL